MVCISDISDENDGHGRTITKEELESRTGVMCWQLNPETYERDGKLDAIRKERGYGYHDEIEISPETLPDYETKVKGFETEHLHTDEEIRFILKGSAFFDVRDGRADTWIRIRVSPGDLLILPAGIYHRLTIIQGKSVKLFRLFRGRPIWEAYNRPADHLESRKNYVSHLKV